eukprot:CAMPEP_0203848050 /NCGR_PEP_ID=MMETSP0359-20131031/5367_1 /ASSEMBLY_ACC=CAM_ASM_000338 /TAXON_ID=268821 /ORGANISM="Scrippsiella Hangoei, Strain SHTV-5" /LENGTH=289 /DNA_ID=CAMNT_0050763593 /DNA_START=284 /DNA_END=1149 /DNA_ORIENTATION=+
MESMKRGGGIDTFVLGSEKEPHSESEPTDVSWEQGDIVQTDAGEAAAFGDSGSSPLPPFIWPCFVRFRALISPSGQRWQCLQSDWLAQPAGLKNQAQGLHLPVACINEPWLGMPAGGGNPGGVANELSAVGEAMGDSAARVGICGMSLLGISSQGSDASKEMLSSAGLPLRSPRPKGDAGALQSSKCPTRLPASRLASVGSTGHGHGNAKAESSTRTGSASHCSAALGSPSSANSASASESVALGTGDAISASSEIRWVRRSPLLPVSLQSREWMCCAAANATETKPQA